MIVAELFVEKLSIKAKINILHYKVLTKSENLE